MITFEQRQQIKARRSEHVRKVTGAAVVHQNRYKGPRCPFILIWGQRVGEPCGAPGHTGGYCGLHARKTPTASEPPA